MKVKLGEIIQLNPSEKLPKGEKIKKIAMDNLNPYTREISGFTFDTYTSGTKFRNKDTLLARITPCLENGKTAYVNILDDDEVAFGSTEYFVLRAKEKLINPLYLYYLSISNEFRSVAIKSMTGTSGRQRVQKEAILNYEIDLPSIEDQEKIASRIGYLDDKILLNDRINANLLELAVTLFDDEFGNTRGSQKIKEYIAPKRGKNLLKKNVVLGDIPVVGGGLKPAAYHNDSNTVAPVVTISASGANAGFVNIWLSPIWSSDSSYIDKTITENIFFWYILLKNRQKEIFDMQTGSAQPHVYAKQIGEMGIQAYSKEKIHNFNTQVSPIFNEIEIRQKENITLNEIKKVLLSKLLN